jgi:ubiquinone/menaquinone biosynthesis C-methylase UbiE
MRYALESELEFERLERQSSLPAYDFREDLKDLRVRPGSLLLDAGCGSGIVSRYLADHYPDVHVLGVDLSSQRITAAREAALGKRFNLLFEEQDLTRMTYSRQRFDTIFSRYVLEHLASQNQKAMLSEFFRCLKPGGQVMIVDVDGCLHNLYPLNETVAEGLQRLKKIKSLDLFVGRKIPFLLKNAGFTRIRPRIITSQFFGDEKKEEIQLTQARFANGAEFFSRAFGSNARYHRFRDAYLSAMQAEESVLFYNRFIVRAERVVPRDFE